MAQTEARPTKAQQRVLDLLAKDKSPTEIAKAMKINRNGVYAHMRRLRQKGLIPAARKRGRSRRSRPSSNSTGNGTVDLVEKRVKDAISVIEDRQAEIATRKGEVEASFEAMKREVEELDVEAENLSGRRAHLMSAIEPPDIPF